MGCVRKRGKSWNAQVRIAGWRRFTKTFKFKSDALRWIKETEQKIRNIKIKTRRAKKRKLKKR